LKDDSVADQLSVFDQQHTILACSGISESISNMMSQSVEFIDLWEKMEGCFHKIMGSQISKLHFMLANEQFITSLKNSKVTPERKFRYRELLIGDTKTTLVMICRGKNHQHKVVKSKLTNSPSKFRIKKEEQDPFGLF
jgi:hypothetical protein